MTIRFLKSWNGYYEGQIVTNPAGGNSEATLIGLGYAVADLDGPDNGLLPVTAQTDAATGGVSFTGQAPTLQKVSEVAVAIFCQGSDGRYACTDGLNSTGGEQGKQIFVVTGDPFGDGTRSFLTLTFYTQLRSVAGATPTSGDIIDVWWLSTGEILFSGAYTIGGIAGCCNIYRAKESSPGSGVWTVGADAGATDRKPVIEMGMVTGTQTPYVRTLHARSLCEATVGSSKVVVIGEYNVASSRTAGGTNDQVRYYTSTDGGRTFAVLITFNQAGTNHVSHAHSVVQDSASGNIFFLLGDIAKSAILRWDGTSAAPAANTAPSAYGSTSGWAFYGSGADWTTGDLLFDEVGGHFLSDVDLPTSTSGNAAMHIDCGFVRTFKGRDIERVDNRAPLIGIRSSSTGAFFFFSLISSNDGLVNAFRVWASGDGKKWVAIGLITQHYASYLGNINNVFFDSSGRMIVCGVGSTKGAWLMPASAVINRGTSLAFSENWLTMPSSSDVLS